MSNASEDFPDPDAGDGGDLIVGDTERDVLEVVLPRALDDEVISRRIGVQRVRHSDLSDNGMTDHGSNCRRGVQRRNRTGQQAVDKVRQHRSRIVQILNRDPAASPLGGAHRRGAPYSSHRAPQRVRPQIFTRCGLAGQPF